jgi:hypothetical protein
VGKYSQLPNRVLNATDKTKRLYKSSTLALGLSTPALSVNGEPVEYSRSRSASISTSWEEEVANESR